MVHDICGTDFIDGIEEAKREEMAYLAKMNEQQQWVQERDRAAQLRFKNAAYQLQLEKVINTSVILSKISPVRTYL